MRCFQICREHSPLAWHVGLVTSPDQSASTTAFRIMFRAVMRRMPEENESENDYVVALIHFLSRSRICLSRFSGAVKLRVTKSRVISITMMADGSLEALIPDIPSGKNTRKTAFDYVQRRIVDQVIANSGLSTRKYALGRSKAQAVRQLTPVSPRVKMVVGKSVDDEIRYFVVRILREHLSFNQVDELVDAWRAEHLRSLSLIHI